MGRPKNDEVDRLRTIMWFHYISMVSSKNAYQLERQFSPDKFKKDIDGNTVRPCQWSKYENGTHVPSGPLQEKVDAAFPDSSRWLNFPLWSLLKKRPISNQKLQILMSSIKPNMTKYIGKPPKGISIRANTNRYNYFLDMPSEIIMRDQSVMLLKFTGLLILIIDAEKKGDAVLLRRALKASVLILPFIVDMFFNCIRDEFYDVFLNRFSLNDKYIELIFTVLRAETPYFDLFLKKGTSYPPNEYYLI